MYLISHWYLLRTGICWLKRWFFSGVSTVQLGGTCLWPASLPPMAQRISLTVFPCPVFHPSSFSSNKHIQTKMLRRANLSPGQRTSHRPVAGILEKRQVVVWHSRMAAPLDHHVPPKSRTLRGSQPWWAYRCLLIQPARWGWRLLWYCSLGVGQAHLCQTATEHPVCISILRVRQLACLNFHQHCCLGCWQHSAVVLRNINATSIQAWRKCKMSTNGGVWPSTRSFLCMCQN